MEHEDDYLWDPSTASGREPDPEIARLERVLARYRWVPERPAFASRGLRPRAWVALAAAAAVAASVAIALFAARPDTSAYRVPAYRVTGLAGRKVVRAGETIATGSGARARVEIGGLGHVEIEPDTRLRVEDCGVRVHRLHLDRGAVSATIDAEPRRFQIGTPAGLAVDLGCAYELAVDDAGRSVLRVTAGQVAFEFDGRDVYVPAGAVCISMPVRGPSAPVFEASSARFQAAVEALEFDPDPDPRAIADLIDAVEYEDTLTLWHMFDSARSAQALRDACYAKLAKRFPRPAGVTEAGLLAGDRAMRAEWMEGMKPAWRIAN